MIDFRALTVFMEVTVSRNMTLAAEKMGLTQSAVSQAIRKLEEDLGVCLIHKGKRPLALTKAGEILEQRARPLLRDAARLPQFLVGASNDKSQELKIGVVYTFASTAGAVFTGELMKSVTHVAISSGFTPALGPALLRNEFDVIITTDALDDHYGLERFELLEEPFVLLVPNNERVRMAKGSLQAIASELPMIRYSSRSHIGLQIDHYLRQLNVPIDRRIEVDGSDSVVGMVASGAGWAIATPLCLLHRVAHYPGIAMIDLEPPRINRRLSVLCRTDGPIGLMAQITEAAADALRRTCVIQLEMIDPDLARQIKVRCAGTLNVS